MLSDGSKCDLGRIQGLFGTEATVAVQDPAYPVYVDSSVMNGRFTGFNEETKQYEGITYMPCHAGNDFFPDLAAAKVTQWQCCITITPIMNQLALRICRLLCHHTHC